MDGMVLGLFLVSTFFGGAVSGLAGFAMGLVVSGIWLHILTPVQTAALIVGYGVLGGMTGLAGPFITIWCQLRGWSKDEQRAIFQPVILAAFVLTAMSLSVVGAINSELIKLYVYGLPFLAAGVWSGLKLYGHLDDAAFRKVILVQLLISGVVLVVPELMFR